MLPEEAIASNPENEMSMCLKTLKLPAKCSNATGVAKCTAVARAKCLQRALKIGNWDYFIPMEWIFFLTPLLITYNWLLGPFCR